jgi:ABC-type amino acid transport substrate-binding protein
LTAPLSRCLLLRADDARRFSFVLLFLLLAPVCSGVAADPEEDIASSATETAEADADAIWGRKTLTVATREVPPFAFRGPDDRWRGIAIDLWSDVAEQLDADYRFQELGLTEMLDAVAQGQVDAAVAALTITSDREKRIDFSHPFHTSGLGVAVHQQPAGGFATVLKRLFSGQFLTVLAGLLALLASVGILVWLAEHRSNAQFPRTPTKGIGAGVWWSAVTMTTVGYGDKAPTTLLGRIVAMVWMFAALIIITGFTAAITTALTVGELGRAIERAEDLYGARVVTVGGSTSDALLSKHRVQHALVDSLPDALVQVADGQADAVVYDAPILKYLVSREYQGRLRVLPLILQREDYGIALPQGSPAREALNKALLLRIRSDDWREKLADYLGREG